MVLSESIRTSIEEIRAHKLRSALTLFGIVLGTFAMVIVLSVLNGVRAAVWQGFEDLGFDGVVMVSQKTPTDKLDRARQHLSRGVRPEDEQWMRRSDLVKAFAPVGESRAVVTSGRVSRRVTVLGITQDFSIAKKRGTSEGRFIAQRDQELVAPVCVLGEKLKKRLFGGEEAIGQQVNLGGRRLTVVGVGTKFNMEFVNDDDMRRETEGIYIPLSTYETIFGRKNAVSYVIIKATDPDLSLALEADTRSRMALAHNGVHDIEVNNIGKDMLKERGAVTTILRNWLIVFVSIAGVSLLIGAVGIFSVLKISISERLFEIGLRKSIGATDGEIFMQFLIESITLSTIGALIGSAGGCIVVKIISKFFPAGLPVSFVGLITAVSFAIGAGLFAGLYPSLTASRLAPVDALRA
jgi:putative ABC transport system permease protein